MRPDGRGVLLTSTGVRSSSLAEEGASSNETCLGELVLSVIACERNQSTEVVFVSVVTAVAAIMRWTGIPNRSERILASARHTERRSHPMPDSVVAVMLKAKAVIGWHITVVSFAVSAPFPVARLSL
jgi:hypothetical protein